MPKIRYYKLEYPNRDVLTNLLEQLQTVCQYVEFFPGPIGEVYLSVNGHYDPQAETGRKTAEDVIFDFRKDNVRKRYQYNRKPTVNYQGSWQRLQSKQPCAFTYGGYTFTPVRRLDEAERSLSLHELTLKFGLATSPAFQRCDLKSNDPANSRPVWDYAAFYKAANCNYDLFRLGHQLVIPCQNYLALAN